MSAERGGLVFNPSAADAHECDVEECGCPFDYVSHDVDIQLDGTRVDHITLRCEWGHTTMLRLTKRQGATCYKVERLGEGGWEE